MHLKNLKKVANYLRLFAQEITVDGEGAEGIGMAIGIDWESSPFSPEDLAKGISVELEHGKVDQQTNVTDDDLEKTAKIAWAHLKESPKYYVLLEEMEKKFEQD